MEKRYLNIKDAAIYLGTTPNTLYDWKRKGKIPFIKLNGSLKFDKMALDRMMEKYQISQLQ